MTPQDKALELCQNFHNVPIKDSYYGMNWQMARECALIAVEEILKYQEILMEFIPADDDGYAPQFWNQVKTEIENL